MVSMGSSIIMILVYLGILFLPVILILIVLTLMARKKRKFKEKYGCSQEYYEQLKKLKELYDCGILTAEEYEAKKKQFLGL